jgi:orotidine-5'-phosphate decarboxylase
LRDFVPNTNLSSSLSEGHGVSGIRRSMTIESRMERIEAMMESFLSMQPGIGMGASLRASVEPEQNRGDGKDYQGRGRLLIAVMRD